jgi:hypothetical protein
MTETERITNATYDRYAAYLYDPKAALQDELEEQAKWLQSYPHANILQPGTRNRSRRLWPRWALELTSWGGASVLAILIVWGWFAWMEAH